MHDPVSILILVGAVLGCTAAWHSWARDCVSPSSSFHAWREKLDRSGFSRSGRHECAASRAEGIRLCCPARGCPSRAFPGTCCHCPPVLASNAQSLPPAAWLLPKSHGAGARADCCLPVLPGQLPTAPSLLGIALLWENLLLGRREGAARVGPM